jgi:hypothetical protein
MGELALASYNTFGQTIGRRSDGFVDAHFSTSRLRKCACGQLFLWTEHVVHGKPPLEDYSLWLAQVARALAPAPAPVVFSRRALRAARAFGLDLTPVPVVVPPLPPEPEFLPTPGRLTPDELEDALSKLDGSEGASVEAEIRLWCFWNRNHRRWRDEGEGGAGLPDSNTARLLELLPADPDKAILVRGQALRDVGRFDEAAAVYARMPEDSLCRALLIELAHDRRRDIIVDLGRAVEDRRRQIGWMEHDAENLEKWAQENRSLAEDVQARAAKYADQMQSHELAGEMQFVDAIHARASEMQAKADGIRAEVAKLKGEL